MAQEASKAKNIGLWILIGLLTFFFVSNGIVKVLGMDPVTSNLEDNLNVPSWAIPIIGVIEVAGGIAIAFPRTRFYGAAAMTATMTGAVLTHWINADFVMWLLPFVAGVGAAFLAWKTRPDHLPLIGRSGGAAA